MALMSSYEEGNLGALQGQNADSVAEGSVEENTVAVEISVGLAEKVVGAEVVAVGLAGLAGFDGLAGEVEKDAAVGSDLAASTKECRSGERSAYELQSAF